MVWGCVLALGLARGADGATPRDDASAATLQDPGQVEALIASIVDTSFPELSGVRITLAPLSSPSVYFASQPHAGSWLSPFAKTRYLIRVNPRVYDADPSVPPLPLQAAEAILAHELAHTLGYVEGGSAGILRAGLEQLSLRSLIRSERRTDLVAVSRGYADGLVAYRRWIYPTLNAEQEERKRAIYLSPEEIHAIVVLLEQDPDRLDGWLSDPPRSLRALTPDP